MQKIKKGDLLENIKSLENGNSYYFVGFDSIMNFDGVPCVILATDIKNKNTYARYTQQILAAYGYYI